MPKREPSSGRQDATPAATVAAALELMDLGLRPIPCWPGTKRPAVHWRRFQHEPPDADTVAEWWREWPDGNLAVLTGTVGGVSVLDLDPGAQFPPVPDLALPAGLVIATPRGGFHHYFAHVPGLRCSAGRLAHAVDVRAEGGYVLAPPSVVGDNPYRVLVGSLADALEESCPAWLLDMLAATGHFAASGGQGEPQAEPVAGQPETDADGLPAGLSGAARHFLASGAAQGHRNAATFQAACELAGLGVPQADAEALFNAACWRCKPPLPRAEARRAAASAYSRPRTPALGAAGTGPLVVGADLAGRRDLSWPAKAVLAALRRHQGPSGLVFPSLPTLCAALGMSEQTVRRAIRDLEAAGLVKVERRSGYPNHYHLQPLPDRQGRATIRTGAAPAPRVPGGGQRERAVVHA